MREKYVYTKEVLGIFQILERTEIRLQKDMTRDNSNR